MMSAAELADRLATGWAMCEAERDLNRKSGLERHWLQLLKEYKKACDLETVTDRPSDRPHQEEMRYAS